MAGGSASNMAGSDARGGFEPMDMEDGDSADGGDAMDVDDGGDDSQRQQAAHSQSQQQHSATGARPPQGGEGSYGGDEDEGGGSGQYGGGADSDDGGGYYAESGIGGGCGATLDSDAEVGHGRGPAPRVERRAATRAPPPPFVQVTNNCLIGPACRLATCQLAMPSLPFPRMQDGGGASAYDDGGAGGAGLDPEYLRTLLGEGASRAGPNSLLAKGNAWAGPAFFRPGAAPAKKGKGATAAATRLKKCVGGRAERRELILPPTPMCRQLAGTHMHAEAAGDRVARKRAGAAGTCAAVQQGLLHRIPFVRVWPGAKEFHSWQVHQAIRLTHCLMALLLSCMPAALRP